MNTKGGSPPADPTWVADVIRAHDTHTELVNVAVTQPHRAGALSE